VRVETVYNAARAHCVSEMHQFHAKLWEDAERHHTGQPMPPPDRLLLARFQLCRPVLEAIERVRPQDFHNEQELRRFLLDAIRTTPPFSTPPAPEVALVRDALADFITQLSAEQAASYPRVPVRHPISPTRRRKIVQEARQRWRFDTSDYGHPYTAGAVPAETLVLHSRAVRQELGSAPLARIVRAHGIDRVFEIHHEPLQGDVDVEQEPELCLFRGYETYWTSRGVDWLIYASHELVTTFGGAWLIDAIQRAWPQWEKNVALGPAARG
jgi:hypothetical protein